ncbi:odorant receptor coreceptor-like isoform X2 [Nilaparvata lugens]|uniref:odorant receptor coreceptor-like isoform X2 n=1 Tax=Nilaparvata lugens TaxID=108931 RepID=UPI00193D9708|nr:odorant receptor coreceptor-like isoform X2 [Nilaparvata lugens]
MIQRGMLEIYGPILLFLLLIGGVFLCTKAITLLEINKLNDAHLFRNLFRMIQSVLSFTSYIFVFCWYGEEITQAGAEVFDALYFCPWFNTPNKLKRAIHTMMICNLKASQMSVAGLKTLNLKTFGEVVSAAYSYFNIVRSMK